MPASGQPYKQNFLRITVSAVLTLSMQKVYTVGGANNCARKKKRTAEFGMGTEREFGHVLL